MRIRPGHLLAALLMLAASCGTVASAQTTIDVLPFGRSDDPVSLRSEAFEAGQWASFTSAATALTRVRARFALGKDAIAEAERKLAELDREIAAIARQARNSGDNSERQVARAAELNRQREALNAKLRADFPAYFGLTRPYVLSMERTQALLADDEALLFIYSAGEASYSFAVTAEGASWSRSEELARQPLVDLVTGLRASLKQNMVDAAQAFDLAAAHRLYAELVLPVEPLFRNKAKLILVTSSPLDRLPLQMLPTHRPDTDVGGDVAFRQSEWLIDRYVITTLPAVNSLEALRCFAVGRGKVVPACPPAKGEARAAAGTSAGPELIGYGAPSLGEPASPWRVPKVSGDGLADPDLLRSLPALPGTERELAAIAAGRPGRKVSIHVAAEATEGRLKGDRDLQGARYLVFSTHGLREGESGGSGEAGLVFTPPAQASELDDGLLTASEAAQLALDAELVVLSACNTADGSEALAGLARSFLYAGARSVMASHWEVSDGATADLMKAMFQQSKRPGADQLREAMLAVRKQEYFASPGFWAPFIFVGLPD
jgi:CHAT domain-containing protein